MNADANSTRRQSIRIGGASGFWGDSSLGAPQLVKLGQIDYLVFDYLAELTMSIMAAQRLKNPEAGFALDFVAVACRQVLAECLQKGIRIISNAGGVNPEACGRALQTLADELGLKPKIAVITGDNVLPQVAALREAGIFEFTGTPTAAQAPRALPEKLATANAYLGAGPIAVALDGGADVIITGRCVDSAVTLGACMHAFGWAWDDWDKLAQASLAGHVIECGAQGTGGLFTDWQTVPDWDSIGYPVVEVSADSSFVATKPEHTGGLVTPAVIAEQIVYEIGDPRSYVLPDVVCDFSAVQLEQIGDHRVRVTGARGRVRPAQLKVSSTFLSGYKCTVQLAIIGFDAAAKARRTGEALIARTSAMFKLMGLPGYSATRLDVLGTESALGPHASAQAQHAREVILRLSVRHPDKKALELFSREIAAPGTSFSPGTTGMDGGRPTVNPAIAHFAWLIDRNLVHAEVSLSGQALAFEDACGILRAAVQDQAAPGLSVAAASGTAPDVKAPLVKAPLIAIAHGRSGDKGDISNIGIIARSPAAHQFLQTALSAELVKQHLAYCVLGPVTRFELPGIGAFNFVCEQALDGGGMASLRHDPLGKAMAQLLLMLELEVPESVLASIST